MIIVFEMSVLKEENLIALKNESSNYKAFENKLDPICFCVGFISAREHLHFQITMEDLILRS